jgi:ubiquinone/menaquinone biosynthesis C-methylase UbiE/uncharacterized protein YbaR (Trm112 family)
MREEMWKILCCPCCHSELESKLFSFTCQECRKEYPLRNSIPVFLPPSFLNRITYGVVHDEKISIDQIKEMLNFYYIEITDESVKYLSDLLKETLSIKKSKDKLVNEIRDFRERFYNIPLDGCSQANALIEKFMELLGNNLSKRERYESRRLDILEIGMGTHGVLREISRDHNCVGVDISWAFLGIRYLLNIFGKNKGEYIEPICANALSLPFKERSFDVVMGSRCFHHFPQPGMLLRELSRVLKNEGAIIFFGEPVCYPITYFQKFQYRYLIPESRRGLNEYIYTPNQYRKNFRRAHLRPLYMETYREKERYKGVVLVIKKILRLTGLVRGGTIKFILFKDA